MTWAYHTHIHVPLLGFYLLIIPPITAQQPPPWAETESNNKNYNSPMATALIVMIIVFFTVGFVSVYLRHFLACLGVRPYTGTHRGIGGGVHFGGWNRETPPQRGLDPSIINTFPTFLYSDVKIHRVGKTTPLECAICLNEFHDHEILRLLPKCNHVFHPHCVDPWLASHVTCPVCRENLEMQLNNQRSYDHQHISEIESEPSDQIVNIDDHNQIDHVIVRIASPDTQEMIKGLSESGRLRLNRSHSTGHSLVDDCERFTLRLPVEVRNKLVNVNNSNGLPDGIISPRVGYRARSVSGATLPGKPDRWRFTMSPPFIFRPNSPINNNNGSGNDNGKDNTSTSILRSPKSLIKLMKSPNKSPLNRVVSCNDIGERSSDRLWANRGPHELNLEDN